MNIQGGPVTRDVGGHQAGESEFSPSSCPLVFCLEFFEASFFFGFSSIMFLLTPASSLSLCVVAFCGRVSTTPSLYISLMS